MTTHENRPPPIDYAALAKLSDEELMRRLQLGDHDSLALLFDRYQRLVMNMLFGFCVMREKPKTSANPFSSKCFAWRDNLTRLEAVLKCGCCSTCITVASTEDITSPSADSMSTPSIARNGRVQ